MTEVAIRHGSGLTISGDQTWWDERQNAALAQIGLGDAGEGDRLVFLHVCQRTGLDPFARQIHMVSRNTKDGNNWVKKWTIQTGIDGFRLIADRADRRDGTMREYEDTQWCGRDGQWRDVWTASTPPAAARVVVRRNGRRFPATVMFDEYVQTTKGGDANSMWSRMPANQLAKCAEAAALRKAYPQDLSGLYTDDEMGQVDRSSPERPRSGLAAALAEPAAADDQAGEGIGEDEQPPSPGLLDTSGGLAKRMFALFHNAGISTREGRLAYVSDTVGRDVGSSADMTEDEARQVCVALEADLRPDGAA